MTDATTFRLPRAILAIWFAIVSGCNNLSQGIQPADSAQKQTQNEVVDLDRLGPITSQLPLAIDRRPWRMVNCFNGDLSDPLRRAPWWADENDEAAVHELEQHLDKYYDLGYRRFMLILPAGFPHNQTLWPSSQWLTMPPERRELLTEMLPQWLTAHPNAEISVYMGTALADPTSLKMPEQKDAVAPSILNDWRWFQANLGGWLDCGVTGFGFDNSSHPKHVKSFVKTARVLSISGITCLGEAIPTRKRGSSSTIYPAAEAYQVRWFALAQFYENRDRERKWRFNPRTTEIGFGLRTSMRIAGKTNRVPVTEELIYNFVQRGLIPLVYAEKWDEVVMDIERNRLATETDPTGDAR